MGALLAVPLVRRNGETDGSFQNEPLIGSLTQWTEWGLMGWSLGWDRLQAWGWGGVSLRRQGPQGSTAVGNRAVTSAIHAKLFLFLSFSNKILHLHGCIFLVMVSYKTLRVRGCDMEVLGSPSAPPPV